MINKGKPVTLYKPGYSVCLILSNTCLLKTSCWKFRVIYRGPLVVYKIFDKFQYILMAIEGKILINIFHFKKTYVSMLRTMKDPVSTLADLKEIINVGIRPSKN